MGGTKRGARRLEEERVVTSSKTKKPTILIADDALMNRVMLKDMLGDGYDVIEVSDGEQAIAAVQRYGTAISLILLDIVMPHMDGFDVLAVLNKRGWIYEIPVIMVTSEESPIYVDRAFSLGVTDFLTRPYNEAIVRQRVHNTLVLDAKHKMLTEAVSNEIHKREKNTNLLVGILSHIVEFRNGESGLHVLHVNTMTELLLNQVLSMTDKYNLSAEDIDLITTASSLHDIGKIAIDDAVLNKPGRLTAEEFEHMKQHTVIGAQMLDELPYDRRNNPLIDRAYEICRWHHERFDGRGYPDGLKGDEIPISAQVVALADVYDALTSERVYKEAFSHEKSINMILNGECGVFNPLLLECLEQASDDIRKLLSVTSFGDRTGDGIRDAIDNAIGLDEGISLRKSQELLNFERMKYQFFASKSNELQFEYLADTDMVTIDDWSEKGLNLPPAVQNPLENEWLNTVFGEGHLKSLCERMRATTPEAPVVEEDFTVEIEGEQRWFHIAARALWTEDDQPQFAGVFGKLADVHEHHQASKGLA
ncbi:response regulator [Eggerthellaceae bacterium zg-887]|nr:response regulator [Xiamenia xianingshaonis]